MKRDNFNLLKKSYFLLIKKKSLHNKLSFEDNNKIFELVFENKILLNKNFINLQNFKCSLWAAA